MTLLTCDEAQQLCVFVHCNQPVRQHNWCFLWPIVVPTRQQCCGAIDTCCGDGSDGYEGAAAAALQTMLTSASAEQRGTSDSTATALAARLRWAR